MTHGPFLRTSAWVLSSFVAVAFMVVLCSGASSSDWDIWSLYGSTGLVITANTSNCHLTDGKPKYVTTVSGDNAHWQLLGVNSVYNSTKDSFQLYLYHPVLRGAFMQYFAKRHNWKVNWTISFP